MTLDVPINPCVRSACSRSVAVGLMSMKLSPQHWVRFATAVEAQAPGDRLAGNCPSVLFAEEPPYTRTIHHDPSEPSRSFRACLPPRLQTPSCPCPVSSTP